MSFGRWRSAPSVLPPSSVGLLRGETMAREVQSAGDIARQDATRILDRQDSRSTIRDASTMRKSKQRGLPADPTHEGVEIAYASRCPNPSRRFHRVLNDLTANCMLHTPSHRNLAPRNEKT